VCAATGAGTGAGSSTKTTFWSACGKKERRDGGFGRVLNVETPECREIRKNFDRMNRMNEVFGVKNTKKQAGRTANGRQCTRISGGLLSSAAFSFLQLIPYFSCSPRSLSAWPVGTRALPRGEKGPPPCFLHSLEKKIPESFDALFLRSRLLAERTEVGFSRPRNPWRSESTTLPIRLFPLLDGAWLMSLSA